MTTRDPSSLDSASLDLRLRGLVGDERRVQADFLLHLDELDRRRAFLTLGFGSLWDYCLGALHLREGAAGRRIGAMRVLRRFPALEGPLRDGRLCLSTASLLGQVLTDENLEDLVSRAAYRTRAEVEELVVAVRPRAAPRDGIRRSAREIGSAAGDGAVPLRSVATASASVTPATSSGERASSEEAGPAGAFFTVSADGSRGDAAVSPTAPDVIHPVEPPRDGEQMTGPRAELRAVAFDRWSLRVTVDGPLKEELETLKMLLSHKVPGGDLTEVLREAVRCAIEKHGKRKGAVPARGAHENAAKGEPGSRTAPGGGPELSAAPNPPEGEPEASGMPSCSEGEPGASPAPVRPDPRAIPASVRREVWARDGGRCTYEAPDGRRCGSRWRLELGHVVPAGRGGPPSASNLRLRCRAHNVLHAIDVYGREHMERFRRGGIHDESASVPHG